MSKKILLVIFSLLIQLGFFPQSVQAINSCKDNKISWDPSIFEESTTNFRLKFTIADANVLNTLMNNFTSVRLLVDSGFLQGGWYTQNVSSGSNNFEIILTGDLIKPGIHSGILQTLPKGGNGYIDFCSGVSYQIGSAGTCTLDAATPSSVPPGSQLIVKFVGKANTDYQLKGPAGILPGQNILANTTTDIGGQGEFPPIAVPGNNGDKIGLSVLPPLGGGQPCLISLDIRANAPPPPTPNPGPIAPKAAVEAVKTCPKEGEAFDPTRHLDKGQCTKGGGKTVEGCTNDFNNPGIATAIGCIHTNPVEFTKDILKFAVGIGGGLAFLMMILGAYQMLTSAGNPDSLKAGSDRLTNAIIGLLIIIFSVLLMQIIGVGILNIPGFK